MMKDSTSILIVDDEQSVCDLLNEELSEKGYSCETVQDSQDALDKLRTGFYDVALLDIRLPGISGIDLLREVKNSTKTVIIMITALSDANTIIESMKLGASDYLVKPFNLESVHASIRNALSNGLGSRYSKPTDVTPRKDSEDCEIKKLDAITRGIEIKLDIMNNRSEFITSHTVKVARELGISERQIEIWVKRRDRHLKTHELVIQKFSESALAQYAFGTTSEYMADPALLNED
jgi:DNA-binding response OmpR family regulator